MKPVRRELQLVVSIGLLVLIASVALTLREKPLTVVARNVRSPVYLGSTRNRLTFCDSGETVPADTTAIRISAATATGPKVAVIVEQNSRVIARGEAGSGWKGGAVTVPVSGLSHAVSDAKVCATFDMGGYETVNLSGALLDTGSQAHKSEVRRLGLEYMRPGSRTWWSQAIEVARRMGLGRAAAGSWNALLVIFLMLGVTALSVAALLRELR